ncbi:MAG: type III pantothenate kinase [Nitrosospira sp.]|nr:type III pantothenate kinase [Nitrosospira sp.]
MEPLFLTVDSGNTSLKWGLNDGHDWLREGVVAQDNKASLEPEWRNLPAPSQVIVANVAGMQAKADLAELFSLWAVEPQWVNSAAYQCGVRNYYADPEQLGCDRWAALIAAWQLERQGCLVVDAGTAMTVDALSDTGEFLGGIITPGIDVMQKILIGNVTFPEPGEGRFRAYPDSTADALYSGALHASAGAVQRMVAVLSNTLGHVPVCILSGGAAKQLQPQLNLNAKVIENLVLEGLLAIAREKLESPL